MTDAEFIDKVVSLAERAIEAGNQGGSGRVNAYLDGGLIPIADALEGDAFDPLFSECVRLLAAGVPLDEVSLLHDHVSQARLAKAKGSLNLQAQALAGLAAGAFPRFLGDTLRATARLAAEALV